MSQPTSEAAAAIVLTGHTLRRRASLTIDSTS